MGLAGIGVAPAHSASLPDGRGYELVTPTNLGGPAQAVTDPAAAIGQTWSPVAVSGDAVLWSLINPPSGIDATGSENTFISRRGDSGWASTYVAPPGSKLLGGAPVLIWATPDLARLLWQADNATIDPADHDPLDPTVPNNPQQFRDFYRRDVDGTFVRMTQGSIAPSVVGELPILVGTSVDGLKTIFYDDRKLEPDAAADGTVYQRAGSKTTVVSKDDLGNLVPLPIGHGVSDDGNIVVFGGIADGTFYIRDVAAARTTVVASAGSGQNLHFEALSANGKRLFFTTPTALTSDDTDTSVDLYEYDATSGSLSRISAPTGAPAAPGPGNTDTCAAPAPSCEVSPVAVSRNGSKVYFISPEQLDGTRGTDGATNLYLSEAGDVRFVATLDPSDPVYGVPPGSQVPAPQARHVRFTPDGSKLIFESRASLTGYDNAGHTEIYVHDPSADTLVCASCRPSGKPPTGDASLREGASRSFSTEFLKDPLYPANSDEHGEHIFFQSSDAIIPEDTNGRYDVYEHTLASGSTALISSGVSPNDSAYFGNGIDGRDVFFVTTDSLVPQDVAGNIYKVYDARVGGGFPVAPEPPKCNGEACRGPQAPVPDVVSPGTTDAPPQARRSPATPASKLTVSGSRSVTGTSARLTAKVSGSGRVRATGSGVVAASVKTSRAASYRVTVKLSKASVTRLKRKHRLAVSVTVRFTPTKGTARSVRVHLTFKVASKKKGH